MDTEDRWRIILAPPIFLLVLAYSLHDIINYDIWMHLKTGKQFLADLAVVREDLFSFTARGEPWIVHEWLAQVLFALVHDRFGPAGLVLLRSGLILAIFFAIRACVRGGTRAPLTFAVLLLLCVQAANVRFFIRPFLFTDLFFVLSLLLLMRYKADPGRPGPLILLVLMQPLWANLHGGFIAGIAMMAVFLAGELISRVIHLREDTIVGRAWIRLAAATLLAVVLTGLNPHGYRLLTQPFEQAGTGLFHQVVAEWRPLFDYMPLPFEAERYMKVLIVLTGASFLLNLRRIVPSYLLLYVMLLVMTLTAKRNISFLVFFATPIAYLNIVEGLGDFPSWPALERLKAKLVRIRPAAAAGLALLTLFMVRDVISDDYYIRNRFPSRLDLAVSPRQYPEGSADYLEARAPEGEMFNSYRTGCYLIWRLWPGRGVFIDGRNLVYGEERLVEYHQILELEAVRRRVFDEAGIGIVVVDQNDQSVRNLVRGLHEDEDWRLVHFDWNGMVFLRNSGGNVRIIERDEITIGDLKDALGEASASGAIDWKAFRLISLGNLASLHGMPDLAEIAFKKALEFEPGNGELHYYLGLSHEMRGEFREAKERYLRALEAAPGFAEAHAKIAGLYERAAVPRSAISKLREAVKLNPRDAGFHERLGYLYEKVGEDGMAESSYRRAITLNTFQWKSHNNLGTLLFSRGEMDEAMESYQRALSFNPDYFEAHYNLGRVFLEKRFFDMALREFERAMPGFPGPARVHNEKGVCFAGKGMFDNARRSWEEALEIDPGLEDARKNLERLDGIEGRPPG
ncbi:tetratricopeptide repeat protein [Thermodesulfobacteriota bacterium]